MRRAPLRRTGQAGCAGFGSERQILVWGRLTIATIPRQKPR